LGPAPGRLRQLAVGIGAEQSHGAAPGRVKVGHQATRSDEGVDRKQPVAKRNRRLMVRSLVAGRDSDSGGVAKGLNIGQNEQILVKRRGAGYCVGRHGTGLLHGAGLVEQAVRSGGNVVQGGRPVTVMRQDTTHG
jgi:hypothetical protein